MARYTWLRHEFVFAAHRAQIESHGGTDGIRDERLLESALARPRNTASYAPEADAADLAAAYLFGIVKNHPFVDGNKRVAYAAAESFMILNGYEPVVSQLDKYEMVIRVASSEMDERGAAEWLRKSFRAKG